MKAWHFLRNDGKLRDGSQPPKVGETLIYDGKLEMCKSGLHASIKPLDALRYAPGDIICRVNLGGVIIKADDKLLGSERTILWQYNAEPVLRHFARQCALDVIHLWQAPDVVIQYLKTGDESLRVAAWDAASDWAAARDAARAAAWDAAWAAAWDAARAAASDWVAARDAARAAARVAARDAQNRRLYKYLMKGRP